MKRQFQPVNSLGISAISGAFWLSLYRWISRFASIITAVVVARILEPEAFGLIAIAMIIIALFGSITTFGIGSAVIQHAEIDKNDLDIAWTIDSLITNIIFAIAVFMIAPYVALFFNEPKLKEITRVFALIPILRMMENQAMIVFTRNLDFKKRFYLVSTPSIARLLVVIPLALLLRNVWALVIAALVEPATRSFASYLLYKRIPRLRFNKDRVSELFKYGRWIFGLQMLRIMKGQANRIILGKLLGTASLGYYQVANRFSGEFVGEFYEVVSKVLFPIYAKVQDDSPDLKRKYLMVLNLVFIVVFPVCAGIALVAQPVTLLVLGEKWDAVIPIIKVLALVGIFHVCISTTNPLFTGSGHPNYEFCYYLIHTLLIIPLVVIFTQRYGITGTAYGMLISYIIVLPVWLFMLNKLLQIVPFEILRMTVYPFLATTIMCSIVWALLQTLSNQALYIQVLLPILSGIVIYLGFVFLGLYVLRIESLVVLFRNTKLFYESKLGFIVKRIGN